MQFIYKHIMNDERMLTSYYWSRI